MELEDLRPILDEELDRLDEKYRAPLVLCYLEGKTRDEAARELGYRLGTLKDRPERGRQLLQARGSADHYERRLERGQRVGRDRLSRRYYRHRA